MDRRGPRGWPGLVAVAVSDRRVVGSVDTVVVGDVIRCVHRLLEASQTHVWHVPPASPYLISLCLSKSLLAMVFLAGPSSGLLV